MLVEAGGHSEDYSVSEAGDRPDGWMCGHAGIPSLRSPLWGETLAVTLTPLSRHLPFAGL